ncbi:MAG: MaoC family dehydratase [Pseudomonadota bacterium]|nr:MaoC family dehydratase [Pseudomonadota bacterium]
MVQVFDSPHALLDQSGRTLGETDWMTVTQQRVNQFADATGDHQWIHVDEARARSGPFGVCIAHGYLTLSLLSLFLPQLIDVRCRMGVNYGCDRVRFPAPVPVGSRIRGRGEVLGVEPVSGGVQARIRITVEIEDGAKPACIADSISRYYV